MILEKVYDLVDRNKAQQLKTLVSFLKQPSISGDGRGIGEMAGMLRDYLNEVGFQVAEVVPTHGHPVVYGEFNAGSPKTYIIYMIYDTQPIDDAPLWSFAPLEAQMANKKLRSGDTKAIYCRGAHNSKGPMVSFLSAVAAILEAEGTLPVNLRIVAEGEEELGSIHLEEFIMRKKERLVGTVATYYPDFAETEAGTASAQLGCKGMVYLQLECSGTRWRRGPTEFDIHSLHKAWIDSPVWRLIDALSTMTKENGRRITIDGFYDRVKEPSDEDIFLLRRLLKTFDPSETKSLLRVENFSVEEDDHYNLLKTLLFTPTLNIDGIWGGYTGPGSKTVLPYKAECKLDMRLVPDQEPQQMLSLLRAHLDRFGFQDVKITEVFFNYKPSKTSYKHGAVQSLLNCYREFGKDRIEVWPLRAGTGPLYLFNEVLNSPFIMGGLGHGGRMHSPDEYIVWEGNQIVSGFGKATKFNARYLYALA
jgi:acetylornithine deacetylase/succinyl-diaminopimelate desuccinylase-like protein